MACLSCGGPAAGSVARRPEHRLSVSHKQLAAFTPCRPAVARQRTVIARADSRGSDSSFLAGFVVGGVVFGALGFLFAPQISKSLLGDDHRLKLPRFLEDDTPKDPEATKQDLIDKIAQLNSSIDEVAAQLKAKDGPSEIEQAEQAASLS